jgi:hypothetical protein
VTERGAICHYPSLSVRGLRQENGGAISKNANAFLEKGVRIFQKTASVWTRINIIFEKRLTVYDGRMTVFREIIDTE